VFLEKPAEILLYVMPRHELPDDGAAPLLRRGHTVDYRGRWFSKQVKTPMLGIGADAETTEADLSASLSPEVKCEGQRKSFTELRTFPSKFSVRFAVKLFRRAATYSTRKSGMQPTMFDNDQARIGPSVNTARYVSAICPRRPAMVLLLVAAFLLVGCAGAIVIKDDPSGATISIGICGGATFRLVVQQPPDVAKGETQTKAETVDGTVKNGEARFES